MIKFYYYHIFFYYYYLHFYHCFFFFFLLSIPSFTILLSLPSFTITTICYQVLLYHFTPWNSAAKTVSKENLISALNQSEEQPCTYCRTGTIILGYPFPRFVTYHPTSLPGTLLYTCLPMDRADKVQWDQIITKCKLQCLLSLFSLFNCQDTLLDTVLWPDNVENRRITRLQRQTVCGERSQ